METEKGGRARDGQTSRKLSIKKIGDEIENPHDRNIPEPLLKIKQGHLLTLVAKRGGGKTTVLANLVSQPEFGYKDAFINVIDPVEKMVREQEQRERREARERRGKLPLADVQTRKGQRLKRHNNVFLFSKTANKRDEVWGELIRDGIIKEENIVPNLDLNFLSELLKIQMTTIEKVGLENTNPILIILDDLVSDLSRMSKNKSNALIDITLNGRHHAICMWVVTQVVKGLPKPIRMNSDAYIIFGLQPQEINDMMEAVNDRLTKNEFMELYLQATREKYNFLYVNMKKPPRERFYHNFQRLLG